MKSIAYTSIGSGQALVFLHGFGENRAIWDYILPLISHDHHLLIPDMPGFGYSPLPEKQVTIKETASTMLSWLDSIQIGEYAVIGHSMGGYVALEMGKQQPERCKGLSLFHSTAAADTEEKKINRTRTLDFINTNGKKAFLKTFINGLYSQKGDWEPFVHDMVFSTPKASLLTYTSAMRDRTDSLDFIRSFNNPTLFIAGENDSFINADILEEQARMAKKGVFHVLENVGHLGMVEKSKEAARIIRDFQSLL